MKNIALALAVLAAAASSSAAWEYRGFRSGMSIDEASAASRTQGGLHPAEGIDGLYSLGPPATSRTNMSFCQGTLFALNVSLDGGVNAFAQTTKELIATHGNPVARAIHDYTDSGLLSSVSLDWMIAPGETTSASITDWERGTTINRGFSAFDALCQRN